MTYLLDTNICISYLNDRNSAVARKLTTVRPDAIFLCQIVKAELYYGAYKSSRRQSNLALLRHFFNQFVSLPFNDQAAEAYGRIRAQLADQGTPIGPNDLIIAATAVAHNVTLVTHNTREFNRVGDLRIEDWAVGQ
jgi:tRNA(fMet)-specific endonuclease VapC